MCKAANKQTAGQSAFEWTKTCYKQFRMWLHTNFS